MKKLFCVLSILFCAFLSCAPAQQMRVTAAEGLNLRDAPSADGKVLALIPGGAQVTFLAESGEALTIQGATGKWTQVQWQDKQGWVFGGFLAKVAAPADSRGYITASSALGDAKDLTRYYPARAFDNDPKTAWVEGAEGDGVGQTIEIDFGKQITADSIEIMPGYFDPQWWQANNRVKSATIMLDGFSLKADFQDAMTSQTVSLNGIKTFRKFILRIEAVYKGQQFDDTCVGEIEFSMQKKQLLVDKELLEQAETKARAIQSSAERGAAIWARTTFSGDGEVRLNSVTTDESDNVYAVGYIRNNRNSENEYTFGPNVLVACKGFGNNILLVKYDKTGIAQWARTITKESVGSEFTCVTIDQKGNIYAAGYIEGKNDFDFGSGVKTKGVYKDSKDIYPSSNMVLVKYSSDGSALWARSPLYGTNRSKINSIAVDREGNIVAAGSVKEGDFAFSDANKIVHSQDSLFLAKYDDQGTMQWIKTATAEKSSYNSSNYNSIVIDKSGNIYAVGFIAGSNTYDFGAGVSSRGAATANSLNCVIVKYNSSGFTLWSRTILEGVNSEFISATVDSAGDVYVAGSIEGPFTYSFGDNIKVIGHNFGSHPILVKYNSNGDPQWARTVTSGRDLSTFQSVSTDDNGNIYAAGFIGAGIHAFGPGVNAAGAYAGIGSGNYRSVAVNIILVKYDTNGIPQWARSVLEGKSQSAFTGISATRTGFIYAVGSIKGNDIYTFGPRVTAKGVSIGNFNPIIVKYSQ